MLTLVFSLQMDFPLRPKSWHTVSDFGKYRFLVKMMFINRFPHGAHRLRHFRRFLALCAPTYIHTCILRRILCSRFQNGCIVSAKELQCYAIMGITSPYMNQPFGYKGSKKTRFSSPTRGLDIGYKMIPYVKKATHTTLCLQPLWSVRSEERRDVILGVAHE